MPTIRDLVVQLASPQAVLVSNLIKQLGVIETAQAGFASDFLRHEFEVAAEDPTAAVRAVNGSIVASTGREILASIQLPEIRLLKEVDRAIIQKYGSIEQYLSDPVRSEQYTRAILQLLDKAMIYGDNATFGVAGAFKGFHQIAKANSKVISQLGGTTGSRTTIFAAHFAPGENQIVIPTMGQSGLIVNAELVGGGTLQAPTDNTTTGARKLNKGGYFWLNAAFQAGSNHAVAAITQIDSSHKPTVALMDELVDAVKGLADGMTFIYCNRRARRYLNALKDTKLSLAPADRNYTTQIAEWDSIPVILDESIVDTETTDLD